MNQVAEKKRSQGSESIPFHRFIGIVHLPPCPNGCGNLVVEQKRKIVSKAPVDLDTPLNPERKGIKEATCQYLCQHCHELFSIKVQFADDYHPSEEPHRLVA